MKSRKEESVNGKVRKLDVWIKISEIQPCKTDKFRMWSWKWLNGVELKTMVMRGLEIERMETCRWRLGWITQDNFRKWNGKEDCQHLLRLLLIKGTSWKAGRRLQMGRRIGVIVRFSKSLIVSKFIFSEEYIMEIHMNKSRKYTTGW